MNNDNNNNNGAGDDLGPTGMAVGGTVALTLIGAFAPLVAAAVGAAVVVFAIVNDDGTNSANSDDGSSAGVS